MTKKELEDLNKKNSQNERRIFNYLNSRIETLESFVSSSGVPHLNNLRYERLDELRDIKKFINQL